jgi:hypothetical protein
LSDGFVEVKFKPVSGREDQAGGLVWRWKDGQNYYVARANALENNVSLYYTEGGSRKTLRYVDAPVAAEAWHTLRVEFVAARIAVSLDGKRYIDVEDSHIAGPGRGRRLDQGRQRHRLRRLRLRRGAALTVEVAQQRRHRDGGALGARAAQRARGLELAALDRVQHRRMGPTELRCEEPGRIAVHRRRHPSGVEAVGERVHLRGAVFHRLEAPREVGDVQALAGKSNRKCVHGRSDQDDAASMPAAADAGRSISRRAAPYFGEKARWTGLRRHSAAARDPSPPARASRHRQETRMGRAP